MPRANSLDEMGATTAQRSPLERHRAPGTSHRGIAQRAGAAYARQPGQALPEVATRASWVSLPSYARGIAAVGAADGSFLEAEPRRDHLAAGLLQSLE